MLANYTIPTYVVAMGFEPIFPKLSAWYFTVKLRCTESIGWDLNPRYQFCRLTPSTPWLPMLVGNLYLISTCIM